ncbi:uncharacterized protein LOC121383580 [Gigantopelta aegis]|uniref:uncharacterized protein LOC121383580 n=1 Tax=Gigantopelta aegis TaxID=1735272 RepID=UPI001B8894A8|nr:uncharacterized protein LOC121383580 [Gigantopelta aegis]
MDDSFKYYSDKRDQRSLNSHRNSDVITRNGLHGELNYRASVPIHDYSTNWQLSGSQESTTRRMDGGNVNYGFENPSDGYMIYNGRESIPITHPPVPLGENVTVMPNRDSSQPMFSGFSTGIPTDDIELQAFGQRSQAGSLRNEDWRNSQFEQRQQHHVGRDTCGLNTSTDISEYESDISKRERALGLTFFKLFTIIVILWDTVADWMVVLKFDDHTCYTNTEIDKTLLMQRPMCGTDREKMRQVFSVVTMLGSVIGTLQIISIILDILYNWGLATFRLSHAQYDLYVSLYFEEIPQAIILLVFNYNCTCDVQGRTLSLVAMISGFASCAFRYGSSFRSLRGNRGCCNTWWRCCCCRQQEYFCHIGFEDCFCKCDIPCPLLCCTLRCDGCRWTINTWCAGWLQMFSCLCSGCSEDKTMFGVRIMNSLGVICLFTCILAIGILWGVVPHAG